MEPSGNADGVHKLVLGIKGGLEAGEPLVNAFQTKMGFSKLSIFGQPHAYLSEPELCSLWKSIFSPTTKLVQKKRLYLTESI